MENTQDTTQQQAAPVQLTLQDLNALAMIIKAASKRGAFEAHELSTVGTVYDRLSAFLAQTQPAPETAEGEATSTQAE